MGHSHIVFSGNFNQVIKIYKVENARDCNHIFNYWGYLLDVLAIIGLDAIGHKGSHHKYPKNILICIHVHICVVHASPKKEKK